MLRQSVKKVRTRFLDLIWSLSGCRRPESSEYFDSWSPRNPGTRKSVVREPFTECIPPIPFAGEHDAITPALASMSHDLRVAYPMDFGQPATLTFGQEYVVTIPDGRILSSLGIIIGPDNIHITDLSGGSFSGLTHHSLNFSGSYLPPARRLKGTAVVLATGLGQRNYYHWTTEMLPRLRLLDRTNSHVDFYCIPRRHEYHFKSLLMMGIPKEKLVFLGKYTHLQADALVIPSVNRQEITSENAQYLYDKLAQSSANQVEVATSKKIYIARRSRHWRSVINEDKLLTKLTPLGFKCFYLEDMPIQEQVRLFHNAQFVVGPHGSGLVNLVYCKAGTRVVEIATPVRPNSLFRIIAHHRRLKYVNYVGSARQIRGDESNIYCNVSGLIQLILEMEKHSA